MRRGRAGSVVHMKLRDANLRVNWLMLLEILFSFFSISQCFDANIWHAYPTPCEAIRKEKPDACSDFNFFSLVTF